MRDAPCHLDHGAGAARYVDAFLRNVQWEEVARRLARATDHDRCQ